MAETLHDRLLQTLGSRIVKGDLPVGGVLLANDIAERYGVSLSVVREVVRVLSSLGMVSSTKRVGINVRPITAWNLYDPLVIRWRLTVGDTQAQLQSLRELRAGVEPKAAELAAGYRDEATAAKLVELAEGMRAAGRRRDQREFLALDIAFHSLILEASRNEMFMQLASVVAEVLTTTTDVGLMPVRPDEEGLGFHFAVAEAIRDRDAEAANRAMDRIMRRAAIEISALWPRESPN